MSSQTGDLVGKTFVITGANTGIGKATVEALAKGRASRIVIAARSRERTEPVMQAAKEQNPDGEVSFVALELGDLAAVRRAADELLKLDVTIDVLINNAGVAGLRGQTKDGFELTFGTNHLGHYLWTEKLLPLSSRGHYRAKGIDWDALTKPTASVSALPEYFVSKLANVLHAKELARRLAGTKVTTYSLHPGGVASDIWQRRLGVFAVLLRPFLITNEKGARTQVRCATDPELAGETGLYYDEELARTPNKLAFDEALQDELRRRSDEWVKAFSRRNAWNFGGCKHRPGPLVWFSSGQGGPFEEIG
jgi:dehydrogenase/reductase SDR family protein 13